MWPNQFDADVEMQYKMQRAQRDAERFRLARQAAESGETARWQTRTSALKEAGLYRLELGLAAVRRDERPVAQDQDASTVVVSEAARGSRLEFLRRLEMWNLDEHVAKAMFDDRADLEVKQRGLPVPTSPLEAVSRDDSARSLSRIGHRFVALLYRWKLFCRWLGRLGQPSGCDQAPAR